MGIIDDRKIHDLIELKIGMFYSCLEEVGLYKTFPYINSGLRKIGLNHLTDENLQQSLMRNCIRRRLIAIGKIQYYLN